MTHLAVWEDSVAILFRGKPRHEALGIDEAFYAEASFDQINEVIRGRHQHMPLRQVIELLKQVHQPLMARVRALSDAELNRTARDFFPQAPRTDNRQVIDFIYENTAAHYTEHLPWMRARREGPPDNSAWPSRATCAGLGWRGADPDCPPRQDGLQFREPTGKRRAEPAGCLGG